jgi:hypothetical protein
MSIVTEEMFERQKKFLELQMPKYPQDPKILHLVFCTHLDHEVHEVMDCFPWKFHRDQAPAPREKLLEEMVDVLKLYMNLLIIHGVSSEELREAFERKSKIVEERENEERENDA